LHQYAVHYYRGLALD